MEKRVAFLLCISLIFVGTLFLLLARSSLNYELYRVELNSIIRDGHGVLPSVDDLSSSSFVIENPEQRELFVRGFLSVSSIESRQNSEALKVVYQDLLKIRPSWPYYYSGLSQIEKIEENNFIPSLKTAIMLAPYERKVALSVSELFFSGWKSIGSIDKKRILNYLSGQNSVVVDLLVQSALRHARLFDFCDYLHEQKQTINKICLREFWQPLTRDV